MGWAMLGRARSDVANKTSSPLPTPTCSPISIAAVFSPKTPSPQQDRLHSLPLQPPNPVKMVYGLAAAMPNPSPLLRSDQTKPGIVASAGPLLDFPAGDGVCRRRRDFVFVVNPRGANGATGREWERLLPQLEARLGNECNICESITSGPLHAVDLTRQAIKEGAEAVIAVGGDGTLHEVVNGFFEAGEPLLDRKQNQNHPTTLGLIPLGTGSDFARTFGWKNNQHEAIDRIAKGKRCKLDVGAISGGGGEPHYFINVADLHLSAKAGYYASKYKRFGNLCYILGSLRAFVGHSNQDLRIKINGGDWEILDNVTAVCFGNGKFFGGGMKISPKADPCSGKLEAVILQDFKWYDFLLKLHKLYRGTHLSERNVCSRSVHSVEVEEIEHTGSMYIQADGEHLGFLPRKISILPGVMQMFC